MSRLGDLFGFSTSESNDSLRYSAPKEPNISRLKSNISLDGASAKESLSTKYEDSTKFVGRDKIAETSSASSKILSSAAVRLYRFNPTTQAYEAHERGESLGCVIVGSLVSYQILVYNSQKVAQAVVPITPSFVYTIRDQYMSFTDTIGNSWSALFNSADILNSFLLSLGAVIVHVAAHTAKAEEEVQDTSDTDPPVPYTIIRESRKNRIIKCTLPSLNTTSGAFAEGRDDGLVLTVGMSAGIHYTCWLAAGDAAESPSPPSTIDGSLPDDGRIFHRVQPPGDVAKIKIQASTGTGTSSSSSSSSSTSSLYGFAAALVGSRKGDRMLLGMSTGHARAQFGDDAILLAQHHSHIHSSDIEEDSSTDKGVHSNSSRAANSSGSSWVVCEVTVAKIKPAAAHESRSKEKEKRRNNSTSKEDDITTVANTVVVQLAVENNKNDTKTDQPRDQINPLAAKSMYSPYHADTTSSYDDVPSVSAVYNAAAVAAASELLPQGRGNGQEVDNNEEEDRGANHTSAQTRRGQLLDDNNDDSNDDDVDDREEEEEGEEEEREGQTERGALAQRMAFLSKAAGGAAAGRSIVVAVPLAGMSRPTDILDHSHTHHEQTAAAHRTQRAQTVSKEKEKKKKKNNSSGTAKALEVPSPQTADEYSDRDDENKMRQQERRRLQMVTEESPSALPLPLPLPHMSINNSSKSEQQQQQRDQGGRGASITEDDHSATVTTDIGNHHYAHTRNNLAAAIASSSGGGGGGGPPVLLQPPSQLSDAQTAIATNQHIQQQSLPTPAAVSVSSHRSSTIAFNTNSYHDEDVIASSSSSSYVSVVQQTLLALQTSMMHMHIKFDQLQLSSAAASSTTSPATITAVTSSTNNRQPPSSSSSLSSSLLPCTLKDISDDIISASTKTRLNELRNKSIDTINTSIHCIVDEYEHTHIDVALEHARAVKEMAATAATATADKYKHELAEGVKSLEDQVATLQDRNERLVDEKATLLEKEAELLTKSSQTASLIISLQQEITVLGMEKEQLALQVQIAEKAAASSVQVPI